MSFDFLTVEEVLALHRLLQDRYGGSARVRDRALLEAAVAQPGAAFEGEYLHDGLFSMAAALLFHLVRGRPFVDGNERTGLLAALVFLDLNGVPVEHAARRLYDLTSAVGEGRLSKDALTRLLERVAQRE